MSLTCGQAFRWRFFEDDTFLGIFERRLWQIKLVEKNFYYKVLACSHCSWKAQKSIFGTKRLKKSKGVTTDAKRCSCHQLESSLITSYFRLETDLDEIKKAWTKNDFNVKAALESTGNLIVFRQDPSENLITFLCTQNNNVSRIVKMVEKMCAEFGQELISFELGEEDGQKMTFYDFPTLERMQRDDVEEKLRQLGFGYRASYLKKCAQKIQENGGSEWLIELRDKQSYQEAFEQLQSLPGIGKKVADCICLMSLEKLEAVPIDTHIRQIAVNDYNFKLPSKTLTDKTYTEIGKYFRNKWGAEAGWAQTVLFARKLPKNSDLYRLY